MCLDGAAHFAAGPEEQKAVDLTATRQVALTTGNNEWKEGLDVVMEGHAEGVTDPDPLERGLRAGGRGGMAAGNSVPVRAPSNMPRVAPALVCVVWPVEILAFGMGSFSHSRHLFDPGDGR